jgi:hypothetical protein
MSTQFTPLQNTAQCNMKYTMREVEDCKDSIACYLRATIFKQTDQMNNVKTYPEESDALG